MTALPPATIKLVEMKDEMKDFAIQCGLEALEVYTNEKEIASFLKKEFDKRYTPTWHCFVGRNFGSFVTHEANHYIYFYLGQTGIMLFKSA